ncbi:hypothetical protein JY651_46800 [Pyxidicoccus parkwayensis]|uniref:Uncharacterized protein n=1 Tax=Pyxidicoccus parkwayensis TaxID=2813578 RepID=A0ABX7NVP4_9BACT|nr:hypothetical protein [Pyxidicoccus parkwaysis]QSQ22543.1 hypothetical protein JY651_46800 [Pyxidicoccus parkwaysis]
MPLVHGDDKAYEMARSLLPSTGRKVARKDKALITRGSRHAARGRMTLLEQDPESADDCPDLDEDTTLEIRHVVWRRRLRDKVNPFQRWARALTADLPRDNRLKRVRGLLPQGLIGEHALDHLSGDAHFESTAEKEIEEARRRAYRRQRRGRHLDPGLLAELLRELVRVPGGQRAFNDYLKQACATCWTHQRGHDGRRHVVWHGKGPTRLLMGVHDVLPFLQVLTHDRWRAPPLKGTPSLPEATQAAYTFLGSFREHHGDLAATLAAIPRRQLPASVHQPRSHFRPRVPLQVDGAHSRPTPERGAA